MSSTGIDKVLILRREAGASRVLENFIMNSLKHPHEIVWEVLSDKGNRAAKKGDYGLLIVESSISDPAAIRACHSAVNHPTASVLFLADETTFSSEDEKKAKEKLLDMGATILVKPLKQSAFTTAIQSADMAHIRLGALKKKLDDEKVITRAKLLLMQTLGFTEDEAHKFIEKEAMNSGRNRSDVAYEIIRTYESGN
ncbi:MAG: ANTAR domain-containing protein [Clostridiales bacterium]|nr:ANTAR domain-containing protein [Clostridiales bacterium]MBR5058188.1 ANTAR domain-containing protein [Clostridiales bacterium]